jgi:ankyrin repeat protein
MKRKRDEDDSELEHQQKGAKEDENHSLFEEASRRADNIHNAARAGDVSALRAFIKAGVGVDARDTFNQTPLHWAARRGHAPIVRTLIELGADKEVRDELNLTPLHWAVVCGRDLIVRTLIELGANKEARASWGRTPLHWAAKEGQGHTVRTLIELGANKEARASWGRTPLHWAAKEGQGYTVRTLIELGADKEARDAFNQVPLHWAAEHGHLATVQALVEGGVNIHALAQEGGDESAIVLAFEQGHHAVVNYLLQQGAVLPERLRAGAGAGNDINENQSVHTVSVHVGVSEAAKALKTRYLPEDKKQSNEKTNTSITALKTRVNQLPYNAEVEGVTNKNGAAQRCLTWLPGVKFTDLRSGVTLDEAIALVWMGLTDSDEIKRKRAERGLFDDEKALSEIEVEEKLQKEEVEELDKIAAQWLYEITRGYNLSKKGVDDGLADKHTCVSGSFNKSIYTLNGRHPLVSIPYVTQKTITARAITLVDEIFNHLPEDAKKHFAREFDDSLSGELLEIIKEDLAKKLHAEYDDFNGEGLDVDAVIGENLQCLEYMAPKSLVELKAKLEKEMEVEESAEISASPRPRMG